MTTIPSIHMNGTSAKTLQDEIRKACSDIMVARMSVADMTVHGRDHYVKTDKESFTKAQAEHVARLKALDDVYADLIELYKGITDQT
jgi:hypothetical protein